MTYSYLHTDHKYSYEHPFTLIKDASGKSIFYGSVVYPNGKGIDFAPGDFLGYVGAKEWGMHNIFYDDNKNRFHVHAGYTDIKKDGYSSADGDDAWLPMTEEETYAWNGEGVQSFYPSKTKDFDLNKTWELGSHTLIGGLAYRANSFDQTRYNLAHYKDHGSKINAYENIAVKTNPCPLISRINGRLLKNLPFTQDSVLTATRNMAAIMNSLRPVM